MLHIKNVVLNDRNNQCSDSAVFPPSWNASSIRFKLTFKHQAASRPDHSAADEARRYLRPIDDRGRRIPIFNW